MNNYIEQENNKYIKLKINKGLIKFTTVIISIEY